MNFRLLLIGCTALVLMPVSLNVLAQNSFNDDVRTWGKTNSASRTKTTETKPATPDADAASKKSSPSSTAPDSRFAAVAKIESEDFGVAPPTELHNDPMHAETPTTIPGAQVISTATLHAWYEKKAGTFVVFDVLGGQQGLPGARNALSASRSGSFNDSTQRDFGNFLQQVTGGKKDTPLVFYCQSVYCWMSYNAALRALKLGYTQVYWYRGGIEAWQQAGLPVEATEISRSR